MEKLVSAELDDVVLEPISGLFERVHRRDLAEQLRNEVGRRRRGIVVPEDLCGCDGRLDWESGLARGEGPVDGKTETHLWCLLMFVCIYQCLLVFVGGDVGGSCGDCVKEPSCGRYVDGLARDVLTREVDEKA